ncbi:hypothetical protein FOPE_12695 [Fonsecaea pedrosoi]|nr:hypothetical protein FOPE_12695 [Fonsecaea pedrosoi]
MRIKLWALGGANGGKGPSSVADPFIWPFGQPTASSDFPSLSFSGPSVQSSWFAFMLFRFRPHFQAVNNPAERREEWVAASTGDFAAMHA